MRGSNISLKISLYGRKKYEFKTIKLGKKWVLTLRISAVAITDLLRTN